MKTRVWQGVLAPPAVSVSALAEWSCHRATPRHLVVQEPLFILGLLSNTQRSCPVSASTANARLRPEQKYSVLLCRTGVARKELGGIPGFSSEESPVWYSQATSS